MSSVFISTDIEMPSTGREKAFCVLEYAQSQSNKTAACICEGVLKTATNSNADLDMMQKIQRGRLFVQEKWIWTTPNIGRDDRACL